MTLELRKGMYYIRATVGEERIQHSLKTGDKKLAKQLHDNILAKKLLGQYGIGQVDCPTLAEAFRDALHTHFAGSKGISTVLINYRKVADVLGENIRLDAIDKSELSKLVQALREQGNSQGTINRKLALLSKVMRLNEDKIAHFPKFPMQKEYAGRIRYLTGEEETALLEAIDARVASSPQDNKWKALRHLIVLLLDTGLRLGEALALQPDAVHLSSQELHVWVTKGNKPRTLPLTDRACHALAEVGTEVFSMLNKDSVEHRWQTLRKDMGLAGEKEFVIHALRHTCCTRLIKAGIGLREVQLWMGHKTIETTLRYTHLDTGDLHAGRDALQKKAGKVYQIPTRKVAESVSQQVIPIRKRVM